MGLFSSKKKTTVGTVVARVFEDNQLPNSILSGGMRSIIKDTNIPETVLEELGGSIALKAGQMYKYGKNTYIFGLPSGQFASASQGRTEVLALLDNMFGSSGTLEYCNYQTPNFQHMGWMRLVEAQGYNPKTNELTSLSLSAGKPVHLENMTVVIPDFTFANFSEASMEQWGTASQSGFAASRKLQTEAVGRLRTHTPIFRDVSASVPHIKVEYCWEITSTTGVITLVRSSLLLALTGFEDVADYFQVKYTNATSTRYLMYKGGSGTYPTLDNVFKFPELLNGTFFPFTYFRFNKTTGNANKNTEEYKTSKKLVKFLGMNYDQIADGVDKNPSIADVEQAMMIMAVPANTTNQLELKYLFKFFDNLFYSKSNRSSTVRQLSINVAQANGVDIARNTLVIQDKRFKMALTNSGVTKRIVGGAIGAIGAYSFLLDTTEKTHVYRKQVTLAMYEEIRVVSLEMRYHVFENYTTTGEGTSPILLVPIDRSVIRLYSLPDREELLSRSLHYVFNSRIVTKIKWYQTGIFKAIMVIVAVVIAYFTMGASIGALAGALASGSTVAITAAIVVIIKKVIISIVIGQLLKIVAKAVGVEAALIIALIAVVATGYIEFSGSAVAGAPWVSELLNLATGLAKAASEQLGDMFKDLAKEFQALSSLASEAEKQLNVANKLLENTNHLSPIVIFGETPNEFYNRTIHSGNIGMNAISAISTYVDNALTLPKLAETLGEDKYEHD